MNGEAEDVTTASDGMKANPTEEAKPVVEVPTTPAPTTASMPPGYSAPPNNAKIVPPADPLRDAQIREAISRDKFNRWGVRAYLTGILAAYVGAAWAAWTFGYAAYEKFNAQEQILAAERQDLARARYLSISMAGRVANLAPDNHWILARLEITNPSRRPIRPLFITWYFQMPGNEVHQFNDFGGLEQGAYGFQNIYPGQRIEVSKSNAVKGLHRAVRVYADLVYSQTRENEECIFDPRQFPDGIASIQNLKSLKDRPKVCVQDARHPLQCALSPSGRCVEATAERLIGLNAETGVQHDAEQTF